MVMAAADPPLDTPKTLPHAGTVAWTFTASDTTGPSAVHGTETISRALLRLAGSTDAQGRLRARYTTAGLPFPDPTTTAASPGVGRGGSGPVGVDANEGQLKATWASLANPTQAGRFSTVGTPAARLVMVTSPNPNACGR
jgi:hypothetical protein